MNPTFETKRNLGNIKAATFRGEGLDSWGCGRLFGPDTGGIAHGRDAAGAESSLERSTQASNNSGRTGDENWIESAQGRDGREWRSVGIDRATHSIASCNGCDGPGNWSDYCSGWLVVVDCRSDRSTVAQSQSKRDSTYIFSDTRALDSVLRLRHAVKPIPINPGNRAGVGTVVIGSLKVKLSIAK
jgi:hypothetical protein